MNDILEALGYLDDMAHGRKMSIDPHELKLSIQEEIERLYQVEAMYVNCLIQGVKQKKILNILKGICLQGKDKYGQGTWGYVEFDLDRYPKLKEWLKEES